MLVARRLYFSNSVSDHRDRHVFFRTNPDTAIFDDTRFSDTFLSFYSVTKNGVSSNAGTHTICEKSFTPLKFRHPKIAIYLKGDMSFKRSFLVSSINSPGYLVKSKWSTILPITFWQQATLDVTSCHFQTFGSYTLRYQSENFWNEKNRASQLPAIDHLKFFILHVWRFLF